MMREGMSSIPEGGDGEGTTSHSSSQAYHHEPIGAMLWWERWGSSNGAERGDGAGL